MSSVSLLMSPPYGHSTELGKIYQATHSFFYMYVCVYLMVGKRQVAQKDHIGVKIKRAEIIVKRMSQLVP